MIVQLASERSFLKEQIQKQAASMKSLEAYFSIDVKYVGVITKVSTQRTDPEMQRTMGIQWICEAMAQCTVEPDLFTLISTLVFWAQSTAGGYITAEYHF